jgi:hypothetical protein
VFAEKFGEVPLRVANFLSRRQLHAHYDRNLVDLDQQFYQGKPATNQIEFVIVKGPALSILCLRGHGTLLCWPGSAVAPIHQLPSRRQTDAPKDFDAALDAICPF